MENEKLKIALKFTELINLALDKFDQTIKVKLFRTAIDIKCSLNPYWMIEVNGPFFFRCREQIANHDLDFFINYNWESQKEDWTEYTAGYGAGIAEDLEKNIVKSLKKLRDEDPQFLKTIPLTYVRMYASYLKLIK